jgi:hypothetical protein
MSTVSSAGPLPLLFYSFSQTQRSEMSPRVHAVVRKLFDVAPPQHIAAIFGPSPLVEMVSQAWESYSGMQSADSPRRVTVMRCQGIHPDFNYPKLESENASPETHGIARSMAEQDLDSVADLYFHASQTYVRDPPSSMKFYLIWFIVTTSSHFRTVPSLCHPASFDWPDLGLRVGHRTLRDDIQRSVSRYILNHEYSFVLRSDY